MSLLSEFKEFAMRGSVVDLAVGVIIGGAFQKIVDSAVKDMIMPPIGRLLGGVDFRQLFINLGNVPYETLEAAETAGAPVLRYGMFINTVVDFTIVAFCIFLAIKLVNRLRRPEPPKPEAPAAPAEEVLLLREIRDAMRRQETRVP